MSVDKEPAQQQQQQQQQPQQGGAEDHTMQDAATAAQQQPQQDAPPLSTPTTTITSTTANNAANADAVNNDGNNDNEAPDSPPLPAKHTPATPGPRAARLQALFAATLTHTLDKISYVNFAACYPTVAARAPGTLEFVQRQMVERLGAQCEREFDSVLQNRNVVAKLNELESLVSEAAARKQVAAETTGVVVVDEVEPPVPPHTLPAATVLAAHLAPHLAAQQSALNARLQNTQSANARLFDEIGAQRADIEALLATVERVLADMDGAAGLLDGVADELVRETRAAAAAVDPDIGGSVDAGGDRAMSGT
ncbi:Nnf1-domain-containing protein [Lasiosphaeria ovina]|uniref:Nnf1-domain-containing protein n=1 Tax=Lasiosphaeria ovina TaxID=92902 RepID=A0AAE0KNP9_9PEZI|nr:Nnf1-domain-containing protein [Lasiosphaeria ovina]